MRLIDHFDRGALRHPDGVCLTDGRRSLSYADTRTLSCRIAQALIGSGMQPRMAGAVLSHNDMDAFACILGILRSGMAWMPLNARNSLDDNRYILDSNGCAWLFYHSAFAQEVETLRQGAPGLRGLVCVDRANGPDPSLHDWLAGVGAEDPDIPAGPLDVAAIWPSGGTTGRSKGVMLTHLNFTTMIANFCCSMPYEAPPVHLVAAPMTHAAGCIALPTLALGGAQVFIPRADPLEIMRHIESHRVTTLFLPPTAIYAMLAHPQVRRFDYSSLRHFIYAAAPMSSEKLKEAIDVFGPVMAQTYGQAESPMLCTYLSPQEHVVDGDPAAERRLASCGRATPFTPVAIMDDDGRLLPAESRGEIVVRGNLVMKGYLHNPAATEEASRFGWHHTGDIGLMDEDGYVYIVDRKRDMIISGGFNLYPSEIEQVLWAHPAVQDCAVIGVPDDKWGEAVKAVVELKPGATVEPQALLDFCRARLGGMKTPKSAEIWPELPRSPVGKVLKREIRERFWAGQARRV
ncbi:MAG: AMP-binding protein [Rhodoferax sp.]|nr:AMP-binding protein [Rhodoferax sp.]